MFLAFALPALAMLVAYAGISRTLRTTTEAADAVAGGNRALAQMNLVLQTALDAESSARGFAITGQERFLDHYRNATQSFTNRCMEVRALVHSDPAGTDEIGRIEALFNRWVRDVAAPGIDARRRAPVHLAEEASTAQAAVLALASPGMKLDEWRDVQNTILGRIDAILRMDLSTDDWKRWTSIHDDLAHLHHVCAAPPGTDRSPVCLEAFKTLRSSVSSGATRAWAAERMALNPDAADSGRQLMDTLRQAGDAFQKRERDRMSGFVAGTNTTARRDSMEAFQTLSAILLVSVLGAFLIVYRTTIAARALVGAARAVAAGDLAQRVAYAGSRGDFALVGQTFNAMADRLQERERTARLMADVGDLLQACFTMDEANAVIAKLGPQLFPVSVGDILLVNASRNLLERSGGWSTNPQQDVRGPWSPSDCWALRRGRLHVSKGNDVPSRCGHLEDVPVAQALCAPLTAHGETLGVLSIRIGLSDSATGFLTNEDGQRLAEDVAERVSLAFANLKLRDALRQQAIRDALTGLYNRRYAEETLEREAARSRRSFRPLSVIMVDVDHFKRFNDTHGHDAGDVVLRAVGDLMRTRLRSGDVACRYGGEEFLLILPDAPAESAVRRADEIREACARLRLSHAGAPLGPVTVSAGVAAAPPHMLAPDVLIAASDRALYRAKDAGRNRVLAHAPEEAVPEARDRDRTG